MRTKNLLLLVVTLAFSSAIKGCTATVELEDEGAIDWLRRDFNSAYNAGDAAALAALITEDVIWMAPGESAIEGRDAVKARYVAQFERADAEFELLATEIGIGDGWAFLRGSYTRTDFPKAGGKPAEATGKYLMILQLQRDGSWKIARDIWNSDYSP